MWNSKGRRVKSLNDIPEVFRTYDLVETKVCPKKIVNAHSGGLDQKKIGVLSPRRINLNIENHFLEEQEFPKDAKERLINAEAVKTNVVEQLQIDTFGAPYFLRPFLKNVSLQEDSQRKLKRILSVIDVLLSFILFTPMVVAFWKGAWTYMEIHEDMFPGWFMFALGTLIHAIFAILKHYFHIGMVHASTKKSWLNRILCKSMQILYLYVFGVVCVMQWNGGFIIFNRFIESAWLTASTTLVATMALMIFRSLRTLMASPLITVVDKLTYVYYFSTRFKMNTRDWSLYLLDCAFSVGVVGTLVVFVWRGAWILLDMYLFPEDRKYSTIGSLAIGYVIVTVTFSLQPLMRYVCARLQGLTRLIAADGYLLLSFLGTVNVWRGIWTMLDLWFLPDNKELSCWITHIGSFVLLVLLNCSNSILVRGVYIDAEEDGGKCVVFPCYYFRLFFKVEREKKEARRRNLLVASKDFRPRPDGNTKDTENGALLPNSAAILPTNPESLV